LENAGTAKSVWTTETMKMPTWTSYLVYAFAFAVLSYAKEGRNERMAMAGYNYVRHMPVFVRALSRRIFKKIQRKGDTK